MSWYYGTFSCGCEGRVNIVGPTKDREWKAENRFSGLCPECWEKKVQDERDAANALAAEKANKMNLPVLKGTEKQVAWANTLRQDLQIKGGIMMSEKTNNVKPKLNYRIESDIQEEYKRVCEDNCLNPGRLIRQHMLDIIEKYQKT